MMNAAREMTHEEILMLHMLGVLPRHILDIVEHPSLDKALKPGKLYKTLRLILPQYGFTPGYPETLLARATQTLSRQREAGIETLSCIDARYPKTLLNIRDFPLLIHYLGDPALFSEPCQAAVIGARKADREGCEVAWKLGYEFGKERVVVSGLAAGCDTAAHRGCMEAGGGASRDRRRRDGTRSRISSGKRGVAGRDSAQRRSRSLRTAVRSRSYTQASRGAEPFTSGAVRYGDRRSMSRTERHAPHGGVCTTLRQKDPGVALRRTQRGECGKFQFDRIRCRITDCSKIR